MSRGSDPRACVVEWREAEPALGIAPVETFTSVTARANSKPNSRAYPLPARKALEICGRKLYRRRRIYDILSKRVNAAAPSAFERGSGVLLPSLRSCLRKMVRVYERARIWPTGSETGTRRIKKPTRASVWGRRLLRLEGSNRAKVSNNGYFMGPCRGGTNRGRSRDKYSASDR